MENYVSSFSNPKSHFKISKRFFIYLPKTIHIKNRTQVSALRLVINTMLHNILSDGIKGTWGTINGSSVEFCSWASITNTPKIIIIIYNNKSYDIISNKPFNYTTLQ